MGGSCLVQAVVAEAGKATCLLADELSNVLWVGHADGRVSGHSLGDAPGTAINSQQFCCWQVGTAFLIYGSQPHVVQRIVRLVLSGECNPISWRARCAKRRLKTDHPLYTCLATI